jgi:hypothetical protein
MPHMTTSEPKHDTPNFWDGERERCAKLSDEALLQNLTRWKAGSGGYLVAQAEIEKRKQERADSREDKRLGRVAFRNWLPIAISVAALALALAVALYK